MCIRDRGVEALGGGELHGLIGRVNILQGRTDGDGVQAVEGLGEQAALKAGAVSYTHLDVYKRQILGS